MRCWSNYGALSSLIEAPVLILWGKANPLFGAADQAARSGRPSRGADFVALDTGLPIVLPRCRLSRGLRPRCRLQERSKTLLFNPV